MIGTQLVESQGTGLQASGLALGVGLVGTFIGARGMGGAFRRTCNTVWGVPWQLHMGVKGFFARLGVIIVVCGGLVATSVVSGLVVSTFSIGVLGRFGGVLLTGVLNVGVFALSFRLCTSTAVPFRNLWVGSVLAATCWTALQIAGGLLITHSIARASDVYGTFALVIGLLTWLYVSSYATIVSLQVDVVRVRRLWPRGFFLTTTAAQRGRPQGADLLRASRAEGAHAAHQRDVRPLRVCRIARGGAFGPRSRLPVPWLTTDVGPRVRPESLVRKWRSTSHPPASVRVQVVGFGPVSLPWALAPDDES